MEQICNLVYFTLTDGKSRPEIAELEVLLSDPKDKETMISRQNEIAMEQLMSMGGLGMLAPSPSPPQASPMPRAE